MPPVPASLQTHLQYLRTGGYTVSDICDVLLALKVPHAGYLPSVHIRTSIPTAPTVAPATTVLFAPKTSLLPAPTSHFADLLSAPETIAVFSQPAGQRCAVLGSLIARRLQKRGVLGAIVGGRVRDVREIELSGWRVWSEGTSAVGAGAEAKVVELGGTVTVQYVEVKEGDVVFADAEGVAIIPKGLVKDVVERLPEHVERERKTMEDLDGGRAITDSFKEHRGKA